MCTSPWVQASIFRSPLRGIWACQQWRPPETKVGSPGNPSAADWRPLEGPDGGLRLSHDSHQIWMVFWFGRPGIFRNSTGWSSKTQKTSPKLIELVHVGRSQSFESSIDWCHPYMVQLSPSFNYIYGPYSPVFLKTFLKFPVDNPPWLWNPKRVFGRGMSGDCRGDNPDAPYIPRMVHMAIFSTSN